MEKILRRPDEGAQLWVLTNKVEEIIEKINEFEVKLEDMEVIFELLEKRL